MNFVTEHLAGHMDFLAFYRSEGVEFRGKRALCPFHDDHSPSMDVDRDKGLYICRACGAGGDPVTFLMTRHGMSEAGAIEELRQRYPSTNGNGTRLAPTESVRAEAPNAEGFWNGLASDDDEGRSYLGSRQLWEGLPTDVVRFETGDPCRLAVPLYDADNQIVNVQRRPAVCRDDITPGSPAFLLIKGAPVAGTAFGRLDRAGDVWLVEGLTDYLAARLLTTKRTPLGVPGASNAARLVEARAALFAGRTVYVSFDNDAAGENATEETVAALRSAGACPIVATYPAGYNDLAELVEQLGVDRARAVMVTVFQEAVSSASVPSETVEAEIPGLEPPPPAEVSPQPPEPWPVLNEAALHGLAGDVVRLIEPHTEADPVAVLLHFLIFFGNSVNRGPYVEVGATRHFTNLFGVVVGNSGVARKGTAKDEVRRIFRLRDDFWEHNQIKAGLSTGEGLIHAVRDPEHREVEDKKTGNFETKVVDPGIEDKRLLALQTEFAGS